MEKKIVLIISPDYIGGKMAGPGIRYWNFANFLAKHYSVILLAPRYKEELQLKTNLEIKCLTKKNLSSEINNVDVIILQGITLREYPMIKVSGKPVIIDLYDPFILEGLEQRKHMQNTEKLAYYYNDLDILLEQLAFGDYFICASEKQRDYWLGMLTAVNRVNPINYEEDVSLSNFIGVVPFGVAPDEPVKTKKVLKGIYPGIDINDKIVLWGGGIWNWFDPLTLIKSIYLISLIRSDVKLFFMGVNHPNTMIPEMEMVKMAVKLSDDLGLTNTYVFFNYEWIPYQDRSNYLMEADIGISTHLKHLETRFSFRTRVLDYLWCNLPIVLTEGDSMAELVKENNLGIVVPEKNEEALSKAILDIINNPNKKQTYIDNIKEVKQRYYWSTVIKPLEEFCKESRVKSDKKKVKILYRKLYKQKILIFRLRIRKIFSEKGIKLIFSKFRAN